MLQTEINSLTQSDNFVLRKIRNIVEAEEEIKANKGDTDILRSAKKMGFCDKEIGVLWDMSEEEIYDLRHKNNITI